MLRTSVPATDLDTAAVIAAYKNLAKVERDVRILKTDRPRGPSSARDRVTTTTTIRTVLPYPALHFRKRPTETGNVSHIAFTILMGFGSPGRWRRWPPD